MSWVLIALLVLAAGVTRVARAEGGAQETSQAQVAREPEITSADQLVGKRLAVISGTSFDGQLMSNYPGITQKDFSYYNSIAEMIQAVKAGKEDAFIVDMPVGQLAVSRSDGIGVMPEPLVEDHYGLVLAKGSPLTAQINERLAAYRADGTLEALNAKWLGADDAAKTLPVQDWDAPNGTLTVAASADSEPMAYQVGNESRGLSVDVIYHVARDLGYHVNVRGMAVKALISEVQSGKADIAATGFSITEERKKVVDMTDPYFDGGVVAVVRAKEPQVQVTRKPEITSVDQLVGKRLAAITGTSFDGLLMRTYPGITQKDFSYYNSIAEMIQAVKANKEDAFIVDMPVGQLAVSRSDGIGVMPETLVEDHYGLVLQKGSPLTAQINERLAAYRADGTLEALSAKWLGPDDDAKTLPVQDWDAPNGTLTVAASADSEPMAYLVGNESRGLSVDILYHVARDLGYHIDVRGLSFKALISEVQSGKADIAASGFSITEERKKVVDMTDPYFDGGVVAVVRAEAGEASEDEGFLAGLMASFERTFIVEDRWQLILSGLTVTLIISVASGALGLALGYVFVLLRRKKEGGLADKAIHLLEGLLGGLPVVVVLMVFYYVIFGSLNIPAIVVATLVFTILFGATTGSIMWNSIRAIDVGQTEAGRATGMTDRDTFLLIVLPQAAKQFAPLLVSQFVSLIKDTSVVGYIAVQDLTRVGDLIRARTMEAFFPLIAIAIIYFAICRLMAWLLNRFLVKRLEPKEGPRTIKGVTL